MKINKKKINILIDKNSWFNKYGLILKKKLENKFQVRIINDQKNIKSSLINFILSYNEKVTINNLNKSKFNIVVHESNLPKGKGFSPMTWQILAGKKIIPIVLFEADEMIDNGNILLKDSIRLHGHELSDEWREIQGNKTIYLCLKFIKNMKKIIRFKQKKINESYYPRRNKNDSILDINKTLKEQFNLLRVVDNKNYPAFFKYKNNKYRLKIEKI